MMAGRYLIVGLMLISKLISAQNLKSEIPQNKDFCVEIIQKTISAINEGDARSLSLFLSPNFEMVGQKGEIAKMVLNQLFSQMNETVMSYEELKQEFNNDVLTLVYSIEYKNVGFRKATFKFDVENKLKELSLFDRMKVKTMDGNTNMEKSDKNEITIPFTQKENLIIVDVLLDGESKSFIVDSGSPRIVLNSTHLPSSNRNKAVNTNSRGVNGSISDMDVSNVKSLIWAGMELKNQDVITLNLSHLETSLNTEIYGLIGFDMLKDYDVLLNYQQKEMVLIRPDYFDKYKKEKYKNRKIDKIPFILNGHIPIINAVINENDFRLAVDTGAESNLLDDDLYNDLKSGLNNETVDELLGVNEEETKRVVFAEVNQVSIGRNKFNNMNTVFSDISHFNRGYQLNVDGIVGYEMLSRHITVISYKRKELLYIK